MSSLCDNDYCNYMHHNGSVRNSAEWVGLTLFTFVVDNVAPTRSRVECELLEVCHLTHMCTALCLARIIYM